MISSSSALSSTSPENSERMWCAPAHPGSPEVRRVAPPASRSRVKGEPEGPRFCLIRPRQPPDGLPSSLTILPASALSKDFWVGCPVSVAPNNDPRWCASPSRSMTCAPACSEMLQHRRLGGSGVPAKQHDLGREALIIQELADQAPVCAISAIQRFRPPTHPPEHLNHGSRALASPPAVDQRAVAEPERSASHPSRCPAMFLATRAAPTLFARNRLSLVYVRPTRARSSQLSTGKFTAPGIWSSSNSDGDLTSITSSNSASRTLGEELRSEGHASHLSRPPCPGNRIDVTFSLSRGPCR